jgi:hypothetical protein
MMESRPSAKLYITEEEYFNLIELAVDGKTVYAGFGVGVVWLENHKLNNWACELLVQWRGIKK